MNQNEILEKLKEDTVVRIICNHLSLQRIQSEELKKKKNPFDISRLSNGLEVIWR